MLGSSPTHAELMEEVHALRARVSALEQGSGTDALRRSEERFRTLVEKSADVIFLAGPENESLMVTPSVTPMLGYTPEEFLDMDIAELTHPEDRPLLLRHADIMRATPGATVNLIFRLRHKDGIWRVVDCTMRNLLSDPNVEAIVANFRDITARKQLEEERDRLAMAMAQTAESVVIWSATGHIQYANPAFENTLGYSREEVLGRHVETMLSPEHNDPALNHEVDEKVDHGQVWQGQVTACRKDGSLITMETTISPLRDIHGNIESHVSVSRDITNELRLEAQLRQAQKMEAVGQLAGGIAHDFNNLLQVILVNLELMEEDFSPGTQARGTLYDIRKAALRAAELTRQLLAFSRRQCIQPVKTDLNLLLHGLLKMIRRVIGEPIELLFHPGEGLDAVFVDKSQIEHVLIGLCANARDAMAHGGRLTIETHNVLLDAAFCQDHPWASEGQYVLLSVADTGCGMDAKTVAHIFEPFFTTKGVGKGTGLGLAMVYGIIKQHDGLIHVHSEPGAGTVFNLYLPAVGQTLDIRAASARENELPPLTKIPSM